MTGKEFLNSVAKGKPDVIQTLLDILAETGSNYRLRGIPGASSCLAANP